MLTTQCPPVLQSSCTATCQNVILCLITLVVACSFFILKIGPMRERWYIFNPQVLRFSGSGANFGVNFDFAVCIHQWEFDYALTDRNAVLVADMLTTSGPPGGRNSVHFRNIKLWLVYIFTWGGLWLTIVYPNQWINKNLNVVHCLLCGNVTTDSNMI